MGWVVFSDKVKDVFLQFLSPKDRFHSIELECDTENSADRLLFWLLDMRTVIDAIDYEKSIIREKEPGEITGIPKLAINSDSVPPDKHAFLLKNYSVCLVIDEKLKDAIALLNPEGFTFIECA